MSTTQPATIASSLLHNPDQPTATSRGRHWPGVTIDRHKGMPVFNMDAPALDHHSVVYVTGGSARLQQEREGKRHSSLVYRGSVILVAAGFPCVWRGASADSIRLRVPTSLIATAAEEMEIGCVSGELSNVFDTRDEVVGHLSALISLELDAASHPCQPLIVESISATLAAHLVRTYRSSGRVAQSRAQGLPPWALKRVLEFVDSHFQDNVSLEDMAAQAGVSRFHFARMFKRSTGQSPIAYYEQRRIEHAAFLLRHKKLAPQLVAELTGFSDPAYFSRRFTKRMKVTPARYAREHQR